MIILIEGVDGAGKSTLVRGLATRLRDRGRSVSLSGAFETELGRELRPVFLEAEPDHLSPLAELLLLAAAGAQVCSEATRAEEDIVLLDRSPLTTLAYQGCGSTFSEAEVRDVIRPTLESLRFDGLIVLDVDANTSQSRSGERDRVERLPLAFRSCVIEAYRRMHSVYEDRSLLLDATQPPETVLGLALAAVESWLSPNSLAPTGKPG